MSCSVKDFLLLVLGVFLELFPIDVHKDLWVTQALLEECLELVPRNRDRGVCVMSLLVLLPAEADPILEERRGKGNPSRPRSSSGSKTVLTLLIEVVAVHVGLIAVYVRETGLQLLPECLGNDESWSGSKSEHRSRSGSKSSSLQNSLKNPLQVILRVLEDTSSNGIVSDGEFCLQGSSRLVRQFVIQLGRWREVRGSDKRSGGGMLIAGMFAALNWGHLGANFF